MVFSVYELITAFGAGLFLLYLIAFFFRLDRKAVLILGANSLTGLALYVSASLIWGFSATATAVFLCGLAGIPGFLALIAL